MNTIQTPFGNIKDTTPDYQSIIDETPFKLGDIGIRKEGGAFRIGGIILNSSEQKVVFMHNPYTGVYYGNCSYNDITNNYKGESLSFVRGEKLESVLTPFDWVRERETYSDGSFKSHLLVKKYK